MQEITLTTNTSASNIYIGPGELQHLNKYIDQDKYDTVFCIVDATVYNIYGQVIDQALSNEFCTFKTKIVTFQSIESNKTLSYLETLLEEASDFTCTKSTLFIAIGGGIVCDMTGLIAGLWYRGCDAMYVPTTLLSMVDASVGGKCGIDFHGHKNQLGLIIQPKTVVIDPQVLSTLPANTFRDGCAEIIKHSCLSDCGLYEKLQHKALVTSEFADSSVRYTFNDCSLEIPAHTISYSLDELEDLIAQNIRIKASFVESDEFDRGLRAALNFGHTFAHAYEAATDMKVSHGEAVAYGIYFANSFGALTGRTDKQFARTTYQLLQAHGFFNNDEDENELKLTFEMGKSIKENILFDKKSSQGLVNYIFVEKPGIYMIEQIPLHEINTYIDKLTRKEDR